VAVVGHEVHEIGLELTGGPKFFRGVLAIALLDAYRARAHVHAGGQKNGIASHDVRLHRSVLRDLPLVIEPRFAIGRVEQGQARA
jgi:hypothetical protein